MIPERPIEVTYPDFSKTYYIDMLVDGSALYELKTASTRVAEHRGQALQYLLLAGLNHGKLINLRPPSVEHEFVSTKLTNEKRRQFRVREEQWKPL